MWVCVYVVNESERGSVYVRQWCMSCGWVDMQVDSHVRSHHKTQHIMPHNYHTFLLSSLLFSPPLSLPSDEAQKRFSCAEIKIKEMKAREGAEKFDALYKRVRTTSAWTVRWIESDLWL